MSAARRAGDALLDRDELHELAALAARVRGRAGEAAGTAATTRLGRGFELHGHERFRPGDDPRAIDWRARVRTGALWVRVHRAEGDGGVRILVDDSASMTTRKRALAARLGAALAVVAGAAALPVAIATLGAPAAAGTTRARLDAATTRAALARLGLLGAHDPDRGNVRGSHDPDRDDARGAHDPDRDDARERVDRRDGERGPLEVALARARRTVRPDEQVVLLSDLADPAPPDEVAASVARLARRARQVACVHLVDAADATIDPDVDELRCAERGVRRWIDDAGAAGFAARVATWRAELAAALRRRGVALVVVDAATPPRLVEAAGEVVAAWNLPWS